MHVTVTVRAGLRSALPSLSSPRLQRTTGQQQVVKNDHAFHATTHALPYLRHSSFLVADRRDTKTTEKSFRIESPRLLGSECRRLRGSLPRHSPEKA